MKNIIRIALIFFISVLLTPLGFEPDINFVSTLYTVSGIVFSIGLSLVVNFDLSLVKNKDYLFEFRSSLNRIRNNFIIYFSCATLIFIIFPFVYSLAPQIYYLQKLRIFSLILSCFVIVFAIIYFVYNFLSVQKLKDDIIDKVNKEQSNNTP